MTNTSDRVSTGIHGLDEILGGGLPPHRIYLVEGDPGVGKTTLALRFLLEGIRVGERCLYVTLSETEEEIRAVALSHGWSLDGIELHELSSEDRLGGESDNTLFHPSEVELAETARAILKRVEATSPHRVVFDSLSEMRLLAQSPLRYRRQILELKQYFAGRKTTVLFMDDRTSEGGDPQLESIVHGVIALEVTAPAYGAERRRLLVRKLRGVEFRGGYHDYVIRRGGLEVCPRLIASDHRAEFLPGRASSDLPGLDALTDGGLDRGTSTLFLGPAGTGKSAVSSRFLFAAAERGERCAAFCFDESPRTFLARSAGLGMSMEKHLESGLFHIEQIDPAELTPGQFASRVRTQVAAGARVIVIDSLNGYLHAMPDGQFLTAQLHELLTYLGQQGVTTILVVAQHGVMGSGMGSPVDVSYLADTVFLFRYYEHSGEVRKALSVLKRRVGKHEATIRQLAFADSIVIGPPLKGLQGVMTGVPHRVPDEEHPEHRG